MREHPNLTMIHAYNEAWIDGDLATAASYLAEDVTFDSPNQHERSREAFMTALTRFAPRVSGPMAIIAEFADDGEVLLLYDLPVGPLGLLRCCDHFTVKGGKIQANTLLFDTAPFLRAQTAPPPPTE